MYLTLDELQERFSNETLKRVVTEDNLAVYDENGDLIAFSPEDETVFNTAIQDATGIIDDHLRSRYQTPVIEIPDLLKSICFDIALKRIYLFKNMGNSIIQDNYKDAMSQLRKINEGKLKLSIPELPSEESDEPIWYQKGERRLSSSALEGY